MSNHGARRDFTHVVISGLIGAIFAGTLTGKTKAERTRYTKAEAQKEAQNP